MTRLGLSPSLLRTFRTTNPIESIGIGLLATAYAGRTAAHVSAALASPHLPPGALSGVQQGLSGGFPAQMPPTIPGRLNDAAASGFHDVIWILLAIAALGVIVAFGIRNRPASALSR